MNPRHAPRAARPCRGENLEASGRVRDDHVGADRLGHQPRAERLPASGTSQMARVEAAKRGLLAVQLGDVLAGSVPWPYGYFSIRSSILRRRSWQSSTIDDRETRRIRRARRFEQASDKSPAAYPCRPARRRSCECAAATPSRRARRALRRPMIPPAPGDSARSSTISSDRPAQALLSASTGNGRIERKLDQLHRPEFRNWSRASASVPITDPIDRIATSRAFGPVHRQQSAATFGRVTFANRDPPR